MDTVCQACQKLPIAVVEGCDDAAEPYLVCQPCHLRLQQRSLRPLEWYNLATQHGWRKHLLHDDFYGDDGVARQPEAEVLDADRYAIPVLNEVQSDSERLLDYTISRWHITEEVLEAWRGIESNTTLSTFTARIDRNPNRSVRGVIFILCARGLGPKAAELVRQAWERVPRESSYGLAEAAASCLPFDEGYGRVLAVVDELPPSERRDKMLELCWFRSPKTLDWIESTIYEPIVDAWGRLAAFSNLSWTRVEKWLSAGRPFNLVALDALATFFEERIPLVRELRPVLLDAPERDKMIAVLESSRDRDKSPRVEKRVNQILQILDRIPTGTE